MNELINLHVFVFVFIVYDLLVKERVDEQYRQNFRRTETNKQTDDTGRIQSKNCSLTLSFEEKESHKILNGKWCWLFQKPLKEWTKTTRCGISTSKATKDYLVVFETWTVLWMAILSSWEMTNSKESIQMIQCRLRQKEGNKGITLNSLENFFKVFAGWLQRTRFDHRFKGELRWKKMQADFKVDLLKHSTTFFVSLVH